MEGAANVFQEIQTALKQAVAQMPPSLVRMDQRGCGIVICAGGTRYFTNAWVLLKLLRLHGCVLPVEIWALDKSEFDDSMRQLAETLGAKVCFAGAAFRKQAAKTVPGRWQWALKPYSVLHSSFNQVLYLDADNFPARDPSDLFTCKAYLTEGSLFWPDLGMTEKERPIWEVLEIPYRPEPEFETGQMLIDKRRCWEPLQLALWMNLRSDFFYHLIWGDKDTFRFAWHKFGRSFGMVPYPVQTLSLPGHESGIGAMCQHDFDGNWLFQHRNMAKWSLLGENPRIPGFMLEAECREFLAELRGMWNGRVVTRAPSRVSTPALDSKAAKRRGRVDEDAGKEGVPRDTLGRACSPKLQTHDLIEGVWLLKDTRPKDMGCCLPPVEWTDVRQPLPWLDQSGPSREQPEEGISFPAGLPQDAPEIADEALSKDALRCLEVTFLHDSIGRGASSELSWWEIKRDKGGGGQMLELLGENGVSARLKQDHAGGWQGYWLQRDLNGKRHSCRLDRPGTIYPERSVAKSLNGNRPSQPIHVANHAFGIGDAITGLYAAAGLSQAGVAVVYHTRHPEWMRRVRSQNLTITSDEPPAGSVDLNADYEEQIRYARDKARWYAMLAAPTLQNGKRHSIAAPPFLPVHPEMDCALPESVLDFPKYVLLAPFAAHPARDWPEQHWRRLVFLLNEAGYEVVAIGVKTDEDRLRQTFERSYAYWVLDQTPEWVEAAMLDAQCVIGPDSGMIHLAGLLGVPAICIHSHLPPDFLFNQAPSIFSLAPSSTCVFCRWQKDRGYNDSCAGACAALATVSPEQVLKTIDTRKMARARARQRRQVERDTRCAIRALVQKTASNIRTTESRADVIAYTYKPDCGLGEAAAANLAAMRALGLTVEQRLWEHDLAVEPALRDPNQIYYHHWHPQTRDSFDKWRLYLPETGTGARHIGYWACEIEGALPAPFQTASQFMTEIWTPSSFCQRLFAASGLPVHVVPHAVPALDALNELPSTSGRAPFTVLTLFDAWSRFERKNPEAVIRVFQEAFPYRLDVRLVLKGRHMTREQVSELQADCGWDSRIQIINQFLSDNERDKLFASADVFLGLQRSEGFGLNLARSLGLGLPLITTGWSGLMDFCSENNAFLVPYSLRNVEHSDGVWAEPDEIAAAKLLAKVSDMTSRDDPLLKRARENGRTLIQTRFGETALRETLRRRFGNLGFAKNPA